MLGSGIPLVLGPYWPDWPYDADDAPNKKPTAGFLRKLATAAKTTLLAAQRMQADAILISTNAARGKLVWSETAEGFVFQLPPGISADEFRPGPNEVAKPEGENIVCVANLWRRKGIYTLLEAFEIVAARRPNCHLKIVGDGPEMEEVRRRSRAMAASTRVLLAGNLDRRDVANIMKRATVCCLPSYGEPFGMAILEGMACGKPVVGTKAGGLQHLVTREGGRLAPPRDPHALASALLEVLESPTLQNDMGRHNRQLVKERYDWPQIGQRLEAIYLQVLQRHPRTPKSTDKRSNFEGPPADDWSKMATSLADTI